LKTVDKLLASRVESILMYDFIDSDCILIEMKSSVL